MPSKRSKSLGRGEAAAVEAEMRKEIGFGSHTPREFSYLDFLPAQYRIYNVKLRPLNSNRTKTLGEYLAEIHGEDKSRAKSEIRSKDGHIWAFGSCTPRIFNYLEQINPQYRVYDVLLHPSGKFRSKTTMSFVSGTRNVSHFESNLREDPMKLSVPIIFIV